MGKSLVDRCSTVNTQSVNRETFLKKHAQAFFVVQNEYPAPLEQLCRWPHRFRSSGGRLDGRRREIDGKSRAAAGKDFCFDVAAVFANDGHADAETEARSATWALGGVKRVEDPGKRFGANANTVILDGDR